MVQAISGNIAMQSRKLATSKSGSGSQHWQTNFIGAPATEIVDRPQAELTEMTPDEMIYAHFHQVDQFQVFVAGGGSMGRNKVSPLALHYVDHHTAYGPINAGALGFSFFTLRARSDPGSIYLHKPGYKERLKPTKKRYMLAENITISTEPVLRNRSELSIESVLAEADGGDGFGADMLRMGAHMKTRGSDPANTGGQYYLVVNGSLQIDGVDFPAWSTIYVRSTDAPLDVCAGSQGLEALVLNFPRPDSQEQYLPASGLKSA